MTADPRSLSIHIHGTCVAIGGQGVLLRGKSGAGKSDLALRLLDEPGHGLTVVAKPVRLVADDQVILVRQGKTLLARAPEALRGLLEIRGIGILRAPWQREVPLALLVDLADAGTIARLPEEADCREALLGAELPLIRIDPTQPSAPARIRAALEALSEGMLPVVSIPWT